MQTASCGSAPRHGLVKYEHGMFTPYTFEALGRRRNCWRSEGSRGSVLARIPESRSGPTAARDISALTPRRNGLPDDYVASVFQDSSGTMWVGTRQGTGGIAGWAFPAFVGGSGLPADVVSSLAEDRDGYLWVGTERGLFRSTRPPSCSGPRCDAQFTQVKSDETPRRVRQRRLRRIERARSGSAQISTG